MLSWVCSAHPSASGCRMEEKRGLSHCKEAKEHPFQMLIWQLFYNSLNDLWPFSGQPKLGNYAPITSHLICITLITTEQATLSVNANLLINKLIRQLQLCRKMPKWNMTTQSLSTAPVGLFRCRNEKYDDKAASLYSQALISVPGSARLGKYCHLI